jgi:hypothetical protein
MRVSNFSRPRRHILGGQKKIILPSRLNTAAELTCRHILGPQNKEMVMHRVKGISIFSGCLKNRRLRRGSISPTGL